MAFVCWLEDIASLESIRELSSNGLTIILHYPITMHKTCNKDNNKTKTVFLKHILGGILVNIDII